MTNKTQTVEILRALAEAELHAIATTNTKTELYEYALAKAKKLGEIANRINDEQDQGMQQPLVSDSLPSPVKFELQKIALADDEMVSKPGAAVKYRGVIRNILEVYGGNISQPTLSHTQINRTH